MNPIPQEWLPTVFLLILILYTPGICIFAIGAYRKWKSGKDEFKYIENPGMRAFKAYTRPDEQKLKPLR